MGKLSYLYWKTVSMRRIAALLSLMGLLSCSDVVRTDVLVVGGGASGICAAVQAARMGVETVVLEETSWVGGMLTSAGVSCIDGNYRLRSGIFGEFADSLASRYGGWESLKTGWVSHINFEPHVGQEVLTNIADGCGELLDVCRQVAVTDISGREGRWKVKAVDEKGNIRIFRSRILIDATELGDVAKACGVAYRIGMESREQTGESIAPEKANDVIQDLTYVAVLKDYGPDADMTVSRPDGYDPSVFANCAVNPRSTVSETGQTIWPPQQMITYGALPGGKYMINWPIYGNDCYVNVIDMDRESREAAFAEAKDFTLGFVYFIQTELGMKHLGLADDEFPTADGMPFFPYHRESRRIAGEAFFTVDAAARPYDYHKKYYRTGVAVGDYAVDHHHFRHPRWRELPDLHFYPIPSYSVPAGVMIPADTEGLIVAEKSISVSNLVNGTTRLQPVVMQIGQAAGALAALAVKEGKNIKSVRVRSLQKALLDSGCYIMPYLDLPEDHIHFKAVQRIGATGILRGEGRNAGWSNQTWMRTGDVLAAEDIYVGDYYGETEVFGTGVVSVGCLVEAVASLGGDIPSDVGKWWRQAGLEDYDPSRPVTRLEAAVIIDAALDPFGRFEVDYDGELIREGQ